MAGCGVRPGRGLWAGHRCLGRLTRLEPCRKTSQTIELTNADAGRTIDVHLHQAIHVQLAGQAWEGGTWAWTKPSASDLKILHTQKAFEARGGYAYGLFHGIGQGRATILSVFMCKAKAPRTACTRLGRLWRVTINVTR